jgi:hypothetical protein
MGIKSDTIISANYKDTNYVTVQPIHFSEKDTFNWCDCQLLQSIVWPLTLIIILALFFRNIKNILDVIHKRIKDGSNIEVGPSGLKIGKGAIAVSYEKKEHQTETFETSFPYENAMAQKILRTFLIHQIEHDPTYNIRWTFKIGNDPDFDATINKLQWLGLVTFDPSSTQFFLTDFGIHYCTKYKDRLGTLAYFK